MPLYNIFALKANQDKLMSRKKKLLERFAPFRDGLLERLEQFTREAIENDLQGVKPCKRVIDTDEFLEVTFALDGFDLVLIVTNAVYSVNRHEYTTLASKMFIYSPDNEDAGPLIEIVVQEHSEDSCTYSVRRLTKNDSFLITGGLAATREEGQLTAEALIGHFYNYISYWREKTTLKAMRTKRGKSRAMGFPMKE